MEKNNLASVCDSLLNNADFKVEFEGFPIAIIFTFYAIGTSKKVIVKCNQVSKIEMEKDATEEAFFTTLATKVYRDEEDRWNIKIDGPDLFANIGFKDIEWSMSEMSKEDLELFK